LRANREPGTLVLSELPSGDSANPAERWFVRRISPKPTTYLTGEDLYQIAAVKFEEAAVTPEGPAQQQVLKSALQLSRPCENEGLATKRGKGARVVSASSTDQRSGAAMTDSGALERDPLHQLTALCAGLTSPDRSRLSCRAERRTEQTIKFAFGDVVAFTRKSL
jgi:hypothetical protein